MPKKDLVEVEKEFACLKSEKTIKKESSLTANAKFLKQEADRRITETNNIITDLKTEIKKQKTERVDLIKRHQEEKMKQLEDEKKRKIDDAVSALENGRTLMIQPNNNKEIPRIVSVEMRNVYFLHHHAQLPEILRYKYEFFPCFTKPVIESLDAKLGYQPRPRNPITTVLRQGDHVVLEVYNTNDLYQMLKNVAFQNFDNTTKLIVHLNIRYENDKTIRFPKLSIPYSVRVGIDERHHHRDGDMTDMYYTSYEDSCKWEADLFRITPDRRVVLLPYEEENRDQRCKHHFKIPSHMTKKDNKYVITFTALGSRDTYMDNIDHTIEIDE